VYDLLIKGGRVIDGTGAPSYEADVAVRGDSIVAIGLGIEGEAKTTVEASGLAVTPGFIDIHTHSDMSFLIDPLADSKVRQGVTTEVTGNCGMSFCAPLIGMAREQFDERLDRADGIVEPTWTDFAGYLDALEQARSTLNIANQVGHGTVRTAVMGMDARSPTTDELRRMRTLVEESLDAGALGISTGLWYPPGAYSLTEEVVELTKPAAERGLFYSSHIRSQSTDLCGLIPAHEEAVEIGRRTGVRVQIAHVKASHRATWGRGAELIESMERARAEGIDVAGDQYPYAWSSTSVSAAMFPRWIMVGGRNAALQRLVDPETRAQIKQWVTGEIDAYGGPDGAVIASLSSKPEYEGLHMGDIAADMGCDVEEGVVRLFEIADAPLVLHSMSDDDVYVIAASPLIAVASDGSSLRTEGPLAAGKPHPRNYSTNVRFLGHMVREKGLASLEEGVRRMTTLPASRLGLTRRGRLAPSYAADIVVFDPKTVGDQATYVDPHQYAVGVRDVFVNGTASVMGGEPTGETPGCVLRSKSD